MAFLRHIALRTKDMEASRRFYGNYRFCVCWVSRTRWVRLVGRYAEHDDSSNTTGRNARRLRKAQSLSTSVSLLRIWRVFTAPSGMVVLN